MAVSSSMGSGSPVTALLCRTAKTFRGAIKECEKGLFQWHGMSFVLTLLGVHKVEKSGNIRGVCLILTLGRVGDFAVFIKCIS